LALRAKLSGREKTILREHLNSYLGSTLVSFNSMQQDRKQIAPNKSVHSMYGIFITHGLNMAIHADFTVSFDSSVIPVRATTFV